MRIVHRILFLICILFIAISNSAIAESIRDKNILILNSYHDGFLWSDQIMDGIKSVLISEQNAELHIEYMDTKHTAPSQVFPLLEQLYEKKYANVQFDVIIVSDNNAFDFIVDRHHKLFPGVPVVFCGVNNIEDALQDDLVNITGIAEKADLKKTIELALAIFPETVNMAVISDCTTTGEVNFQQYRQIRHLFEDRLSITELRKLTLAELKQRMEVLPKKTIVLNLSYFQDPSGKRFSYKESNSIVAMRSDLPVFSAWDFMVGTESFGGFIVSGRMQGEHAAKIAGRILDGESADDIPVQRQSPNIAVVSYPALQRFNIPVSKLPPDCIIINEPTSFFYTHKWLMISILLSLIIQSGIIIVLFINISKRKAAESAISAQREQLRIIIDAAPAYIYLMDEHCRYKLVNKAFAQSLGLSRTDVIGKTVYDIYPDAPEEFFEDSKKVVQDGVPVRDRIIAVPFCDGQTVWIKSDKIPIKNADGSVSGLVGVASDITEIKQSQEAFARFRFALDSSADAIFLFKRSNLTFIDANKTACQSLEYSLEELLTMTPFDIKPECCTKQLGTIFDQVIAGDTSSGLIETVHKTKSGKIFPVEVSLRAMEAGNNDHIIIACARDVSERKKAELALKQTEDRLTAVFNAANTISFIITDVNADDPAIIEYSPGAESLFGYAREEMVGQPYALLHNENDKVRIPDMLNQMRTSGSGISGTGSMIKKSGEPVNVLYSTYPLFDERGVMYAVLSVCIDITAQMKLEDELIKARKLESLGVLAGGIAHDFNNLLTGIRGNIALAMLDVTDSKTPLYMSLSNAEKACLRATELSHQLLTFSKGGVPIKKTSSIAELIEECARFALKGSNVRCDVQIERMLKPVDVDRGQISQVIENLIINAGQAMPEGGTITITCANVTYQPDDGVISVPGEYIQITVTDEGCGIEPDHLEKIFDPYFTTKESGTGLGLATSYSIVKKHDGYIAVESAPGKGTAFYIYLPVSVQAAVCETMSDANTGGLIAGAGTVLVMDDEEMVRDMVAAALEKLGYKAVCAVDGDEAIKLYTEAMDAGQPFDAVIMDLTIPGGMGGKETIRRLRELDGRIRAIVSSGYSNDPIMAHYSDYGFAGVVNKPIDISYLSRVLHEVLSV